MEIDAQREVPGGQQDRHAVAGLFARLSLRTRLSLLVGFIVALVVGAAAFLELRMFTVTHGERADRKRPGVTARAVADDVELRSRTDERRGGSRGAARVPRGQPGGALDHRGPHGRRHADVVAQHVDRGAPGRPQRRPARDGGRRRDRLRAPVRCVSSACRSSGRAIRWPWSWRSRRWPSSASRVTDGCSPCASCCRPS